MVSIRIIALTVLLAASGGSALAGQGPQQAAAPSPEPEMRSFRDWRATCDNGGDCFAYGGAFGGVTSFMRISMPAGPEAEPEVMIGAWGLEDTDRLRATIDGAPHRLGMESVSDWAVVGVARDVAARDLIRAMAAGQEMILAFDQEAGGVSLAGISAALLWIDERQGRLDTVTALLRQGSRPASVVPAPQELPEIRIRPATISHFSQQDSPPLPDSVAGRPEIDACREGWGDPDDQGYEVLYSEIGPLTRIWGVQCFLAAYNTGHVLFLTDHLGERVRPLVLSGVDEKVEVFTNVEIGYTITNNVRNRGLGDCGVIQTWRFGVRGFELALEKRMDDCWGMPPELWPTLWRTRSDHSDRLVDVGSPGAMTPDLSIVTKPAAPLEARFGDWAGACNNRRDCFAWNTQPDPGGWIRIAMAADPDADPEVLVGTVTLSPGARYEVQVDGARYAINRSSTPGREDIGTLDGEAARQLTRALVDARSAAVSDTAASSPIPVAGLVQTLQWIDRQQGRRDTETALADAGDQPVGIIPVVTALPEIRPAAAIDQTGYGAGSTLPATVSAMPDLVTCKADWGPTYRPLTIVSARLNATTELWGAPCSLTSYNAGYFFYLTGPGGREPRRLTVPGALAETDRFANPAYDADTRTLSHNDWGNKWGHCGRAQSWTWTDDGFQLQSETAMTSCNGLPPPVWPSLWSTR